MERNFDYEQLWRFTKNVFTSIGCKRRTCLAGSDRFIKGRPARYRFPWYCPLNRLCQVMGSQTRQCPSEHEVVHETPSTGVVDGDGGFGLVVAPFAMDLAISKAKNVGSGWIAVRNSNHFGIAAHHALKALEEDMIGIVMTNASALVAPTFSLERLLGTNPICVAVPAGSEPPFVADLATTTAANGKLEILQRKNQEAPEGWIQDKEGHKSTNPHELKGGGALLPLGGDREHGSHKGYALGCYRGHFFRCIEWRELWTLGASFSGLCSGSGKYARKRYWSFLRSLAN